MKKQFSAMLVAQNGARQSVRHGLLFCSLTMSFFATATAETDVSPTPSPTSSVITVRSKDGTSIAVECAGTGPSLVIVHGGTGDRTRWTPLFPLVASYRAVQAQLATGPQSRPRLLSRHHLPPPTPANGQKIKKRFPDARPLKSERPRLELRTTSELAYRGHVIDPRTFATSHGPQTMYFDVTSAVTVY